ncbi:MAG: hypothetical protein WKG07_22920 [Hymenobacter sp.]
MASAERQHQLRERPAHFPGADAAGRRARAWPLRTQLVLGVRPYDKQAAMRVRFTTVNTNFRAQPAARGQLLRPAHRVDHHGAGRRRPRSSRASSAGCCRRLGERLLRPAPARYAEA